MKFSCLSTFTGLGGMDLGIELAGFGVIGCIEWDEVARRSLKANRGDSWPVLDPPDIREVAATLRPRDLDLRPGELDLLTGAPPCQPYSKAAQWSKGSRRGLEDERGSYLADLLKLVESFQPKIVMLENVQGFVSGETTALSYIEKYLSKTARRAGVSYRLEHKVLEASSFGVPQKRKRAIVLLLSGEAEFEWPDDVPHTTAWDAIGHLATPAEMVVTTGKWGDLLPSIPEGRNYLWHTSRGGGLSLFGWRRRYWSFLLKLAKDSPSWTLSAHPGPATGPFHWDNRPLTIQEMLCLQTFPEDWRVEGSRVEQVRQIGNATPPLLAEVLGRQLSKYLGCRSDDLGPLRLALRARRPIPHPTAPSAVPHKYLGLVGEHPDHPGAGKGPGHPDRARTPSST